MNRALIQKTKLFLLFLSGLVTAIALSLLSPSVALAQAEEAGAAIAAFLGVVFAFSVVFYIFFAFTLQTIANKLNVENSWLAWIPIANLWIWVKCAGRPDWWVILFFIPLANIIVPLLLLFDVPPRLNKPAILGLLFFIPVVGAFLYFGILAFT